MLFTEGFNGQTVDVAAGRVFEIRLPENPTAGFRWHLSSDGKPTCAMIDDFFNAAADAAPAGRGGEHRWQFKALQAGECDIELRYRRRWESAEATKSFALHVRVAG